MGSAPLKRVGGLAKAATITVVISAVLPLVASLLALASRDSAQRFLDGEIDRNEFLRSYAPYGIVTFVQGVAGLAAAVLVIVWMYRIAVNHRILHRIGRWGPGWAIGGWFLPPLLYVIPFLMFRELWRASDPAVPIGGNWRDRPVSPVITVWFVLYAVVATVIQVVVTADTFSFGGTERQLARQITDLSAMTLLSGVVGVAAGAAFVVMARGLTARHTALTGEAVR